MVGSAGVLAGLAAVAAWVAGVPLLLQPLPSYAPLSFTGAIGVVALGLAVLGLWADDRRATLVGGIASCFLGGAAILERSAGISLGMGLAPAAGSDLLSPFHLPVSTAFLFAFAGLGHIVLAGPAEASRARLLAGGLGSVTVLLCLGIYATRIVSSAEVGGGLLSGSSAQALIVSLLAGLNLVFVAWSADPSAAATAPWIPLSVGVGCLITVVLLWRTLLATEAEQGRTRAITALHGVRREIQRQLDGEVRALDRVARSGPPPARPSPTWVSGMLALIHDIDGLRGIAWTDAAAIVRAYRPAPIPSDTLRLELQRRLASMATTATPDAPLIFSLADSGRTFAAAVPVCRSQGCAGWVVGVFDAERFLRPVLSGRGDGYAFRVLADSARLLGLSRRPRGTPIASERLAPGPGDVSWRISVWPAPGGTDRAPSGIPDLLLLLGLVVAAMLPATIRLGQMTLTRARLAERVRLNRALETANDGIWEWEIPSDYATRSDTLWRHLGYDPAGLPAAMEAWAALIHPEDARRVREALDQHLRGATEAFAAQYRVRDAAGGWHWVIDRGRVVERSGAGQPLRMLGISADVTMRRRAEEALREAQALSTMGRLAARVAHEINNPLAGIQNAFTLIKDAVPADHPHQRYVGAIEREIGRIAGVTRQLYETYRPEENPSGESSVGSAVGDAVALLEQLNRERRVRVAVDLSAAPGVVRLPDALLRQAVYNLVQNAIDASPAGGSVRVTAGTEEGTFVLRVRDAGPGVAKDLRERIFEPFFTTKNGTLRTGGMGLGLALVRQSVEGFGGRVDLRNPPEGGAEFIVRLPLASNGSGVMT